MHKHVNPELVCCDCAGSLAGGFTRTPKGDACNLCRRRYMGAKTRSHTAEACLAAMWQLLGGRRLVEREPGSDDE